MLLITHVPQFCMSGAFYPCFLNTPSQCGKNVLKGRLLSMRHKWDSQPNKWSLLSAAWTLLRALNAQWNAKLCMEVLKTPSVRYNISLQLSHSISKYEAWMKTRWSAALSRARSRGRCARAAEHCTLVKLLFCWVIGFTFCPFANPIFHLIQSASPHAVKFFTSMGPIWFLY